MGALPRRRVRAGGDMTINDTTFLLRVPATFGNP
jgi:hypothetical protein